MDARRIALIELAERDGRPGRAIDVRAWPLTLGRALDNDIVVDDPHVAPHHLRLDAAGEGAVALEVLDSANGVAWGRQRLARGTRTVLPAGGAELQVGATRVRLRLPGEALAPEQPLAPRTAGAALACALPFAALVAFDAWLKRDPGGNATEWLSFAVGVPVALAAWCGLWALLSKLFRHRFAFVAHLRIALPWLLAIEAVDVLWPQISAALVAPWLWRLATPLSLLLSVAMVYRHLCEVLPQHRRAVALALGAAVIVGAAVSVVNTRRATDRWSNAAYMSTLPLPGLWLGRAAEPQQLIDRMAPLEAELAARVEQARREGDDADGDDEPADD